MPDYPKARMGEIRPSKKIYHPTLGRDLSSRESGRLDLPLAPREGD